jgi:hypothetical protein
VLIKERGTVVPCEVTASIEWDNCSICVHVDGWDRVFEGRGRDLFDAQQHARIQLEEHGALLLCQGSRPNVWPSGMLRSAGSGRKAYVMALERTTEMPPLVDIFDPAAAEEVATVEEQRAFFRKWRDGR